MEDIAGASHSSEGIHSDLMRGSVDTIILRCLNLGDMYGLEICNNIKQASSGSYILKQPTLYSALKRLEGKGYISSYWQDSTIGGRRHYYKLTETGRQIFAGRKFQWSASKEIIDTLVDSPKKKTKEPVLPVDEVPHASAPLSRTVSMGISSISPYNPFAESDDEYLTLPFQIIENQKDSAPVVLHSPAGVVSSAKPSAKNDEIPPLLKYVMSDAALSSLTNKQDSSPEINAFAKYISPDDYAAINSVNTGLCAKTAKITNYDIKIRPFTKHYEDKKRGDFHYVGRLRLFAALVMVLILIACLAVAQFNLKPDKQDYSQDENFLFVLGYALVCIYFVYYLVRFAANPGAKKASKNRSMESFTRFIIFFGLVISILAVNVLAGLTQINSPDYIVYWVVPCIFAAAIYFEGIVQFLLRKTNIFVA